MLYCVVQSINLFSPRYGPARAPMVQEGTCIVILIVIDDESAGWYEGDAVSMKPPMILLEALSTVGWFERHEIPTNIAQLIRRDLEAPAALPDH